MCFTVEFRARLACTQVIVSCETRPAVQADEPDSCFGGQAYGGVGKFRIDEKNLSPAIRKNQAQFGQRKPDVDAAQNGSALCGRKIELHVVG